MAEQRKILIQTVAHAFPFASSSTSHGETSAEGGISGAAAHPSVPERRRPGQPWVPQRWKHALAQWMAPANQELTLLLLHSFEWKVFRKLATGYFSELGWRAAMSSAGPDEGVDIWLYHQASGRRVAAVRCRDGFAPVVTESAVERFLERTGGEGIEHGIYVTTGSFSKAARKFAMANRVEMIDGVEFLARFKRLRGAAQQRLLREAVRGDFRTPSCPSCSRKLVLRVSSTGDFWSCRSFPNCRGRLHTRQPS